MSPPTSQDDSHGPRRWTIAVLLAFTPFLAILCSTLWRTPFPLSEGVALLEDVARQPPTRFLIPDTSYYRPLFQITLSAIWHSAASPDAVAAWIKLVQILPVVLLIPLFVGSLRPRTMLEAAAATVATAVLVGSPAFRDNLEIPLSYTTVGMPLALVVWMLLDRQPRAWHGPVIVALTLVAVGFKEQGLVLVPLVIAAWWTGAPGARRGLAATLALAGVGYVGLRLAYRGSWPLFEQAIGLGFSVIEPREAAARFGAFPFWVYAYSGVSTIANVLFSEPTAGVFRITSDLRQGQAAPWELIHLMSSTAVTAAIVWWGATSVLRARREGWTPESRVFVAMVVVLLGCGLLSFNYSRDRLGGMAVVFYAMASYFALRDAAARVVDAAPARFAVAGLGLTLVAACWQVRAVATIEHVRGFSARNHVQWLVAIPERRLEFADRPVYLRIMESMAEQGRSPVFPQPIRYPAPVARALGVP